MDHTVNSNALESPCTLTEILPDIFTQRKIVIGLFCSAVSKVDLTLSLTLLTPQLFERLRTIGHVRHVPR